LYKQEYVKEDDAVYRSNRYGDPGISCISYFFKPEGKLRNEQRGVGRLIPQRVYFVSVQKEAK